MAHSHTHTHPPAVRPPLRDWPGALLCSGLSRTLGAGALCGLMWLVLWWALG